MCIGQLFRVTLVATQPGAHRAAIEDALGGPADHVARNARALGHPDVAFAGHVGDDADGEAALDRLRNAGVAVGSLVRTARSPKQVVHVDPGGGRTPEPRDPGDPDWSLLRPEVQQGDVVYLEAGPLLDGGPAYGALAADAREAGGILVLDAGSAGPIVDPTALREAIVEIAPDILLANGVEAAACALDASLAHRLFVVHNGCSATHAWECGVPGSTAHTVFVAVHDVCDPTGAGDAFASGLLVALTAGRKVPSAVKAAHRTAARVLATPGPVLPLPHLGRSEDGSSAA